MLKKQEFREIYRKLLKRPDGELDADADVIYDWLSKVGGFQRFNIRCTNIERNISWIKSALDKDKGFQKLTTLESRINHVALSLKFPKNVARLCLEILYPSGFERKAIISRDDFINRYTECLLFSTRDLGMSKLYTKLLKDGQLQAKHIKSKQVRKKQLRS